MPSDKLKAWFAAARPRTLPLALSSIGLGSFLAAWQQQFRWDVFLMASLTTIFLQILSNLANDYGDSIHGADSISREGPSRAVQSGAISAHSMKFSVAIFVILSFLSGLCLLVLALGAHLKIFLFFLGLGILSLVAAIAYTNGKRPYGYAGLGDIFVLIFFGIVGVSGTYYLHTTDWQWDILLPAASCGLFSTGVLNVNNIRDIKSDREAGKMSIPVRLGKKRAAYYHAFLLLTGLGCAVLFTLINYSSSYQWLFLLSSPLFLYNIRHTFIYSQPAQIDPLLKQLALSTLLFVILFGIGLIFGSG